MNTVEGSIDRDDTQFLFDFARRDLASLSDEELLRVRTRLRAFLQRTEIGRSNAPSRSFWQAFAQTAERDKLALMQPNAQAVSEDAQDAVAEDIARAAHAWLREGLQSLMRNESWTAQQPSVEYQFSRVRGATGYRVVYASPLNLFKLGALGVIRDALRGPSARFRFCAEKNCGWPFVPTHRRALYCSTRCSMTTRMRRWRSDKEHSDRANELRRKRYAEKREGEQKRRETEKKKRARKPDETKRSARRARSR